MASCPSRGDIQEQRGLSIEPHVATHRVLCSSASSSTRPISSAASACRAGRATMVASGGCRRKPERRPACCASPISRFSAALWCAYFCGGSSASLYRLGRAVGFLAAARWPPGPISVIGEPGWCFQHQSRASGRLLNFIGSMSGPVTMKSPRTTRMVSVVIETPRWAGQNAHRNDPSLNPS